MKTKLNDHSLQMMKDEVNRVMHHQGHPHRTRNIALAVLPVVGLAIVMKKMRGDHSHSDGHMAHDVTGPIWETKTSQSETWNDATAAAMMTDVAGSRMDDPQVSASLHNRDLAEDTGSGVHDDMLPDNATRTDDAITGDVATLPGFEGSRMETPATQPVSALDAPAYSSEGTAQRDMPLGTPNAIGGDSFEIMDNRPFVADESASNLPGFDSLIGMPVEDITGASLGHVEDIYYHEANNQPEWVGLSLGLGDTHMVLAPLDAARYEDGHVRLAYPESMIDQAPRDMVQSEILDSESESLLYEHYHVRRMLSPHHEDMTPEDEMLRRWQHDVA